jgi:dienelactone hydrolase
MIKSLRLFVIALLMVMFEFAAVGQLAAREDIIIEREGVQLKGNFHLAPGTGKFPTVVLLDGFPGGRTDVIGIGKLLTKAGINALTFQYAGTHDSQGLVSFDNQQKDIQAAFDFIRKPENVIRFQIDTSLIYLGGWCHGGGMALAYSVNHPEIRSIFSIVGNDFGEFLRTYASNPKIKTMIDTSHDELISIGTIRMEKGALPKEVSERGIENLNPIFDLKQNAGALAKKDVLLVCAWDDPFVTVEQFMLPLYRALKKENAKNLQIIAFQDGHNFVKSREILAAQIAEWILSAPGRNQ